MKKPCRPFNKQAIKTTPLEEDAVLFGELRFCLNRAAGRGFGNLLDRITGFREKTENAHSPYLAPVYSLLDMHDPSLIKTALQELMDTSKDEPFEIRDKPQKATWGLHFLSTLAENHFEFRGVECHSMEAFLQSLKYKDSFLQKFVCLHAGKSAKDFGADQDWQSEQKLYWQGKAMDRHGKKYQAFLDEAFDTMFYFSGYGRRALLESGEHPLTCPSLGKDPRETALTEDEFCSRLMHIRNRLQKELAARLHKKYTP